MGIEKRIFDKLSIKDKINYIIHNSSVILLDFLVSLTHIMALIYIMFGINLPKYDIEVNCLTIPLLIVTVIRLLLIFTKSVFSRVLVVFISVVLSILILRVLLNINLYYIIPMMFYDFIIIYRLILNKKTK